MEKNKAINLILLIVPAAFLIFMIINSKLFWFFQLNSWIVGKYDIYWAGYLLLSFGMLFVGVLKEDLKIYSLFFNLILLTILSMKTIYYILLGLKTSFSSDIFLRLFSMIFILFPIFILLYRMFKKDLSAKNFIFIVIAIVLSSAPYSFHFSNLTIYSSNVG